MKLPTLTLALVATLSGATISQDALLYTPMNQVNPEMTLSGSSSTILSQLGSMDVVSVVPDVALGYSAEKFATRAGWSTLTGDVNGDGWYVEPVLFGKIDAVTTLKDGLAGTATIRDLYLSPAVPVGVGGGGCLWTMAPGDVARIGDNGNVSWFLTEQQVRQAFQIANGQPANVDAVCLDGFQNIILSLEDDVTIVGGQTAMDGAILAIPSFAVTYNPDDTVQSVVPGSGMILFGEATVDAMVVNAQVQNPALGMVTQIGDTDGLCVDSLGGTFTKPIEGVGNHTFSDVLFCGTRLMGGGVLSTLGNGTIAMVNGVTLAKSALVGWSTDGEEVGIDPNAGTIGSLNALELTPVPGRFVLDSKDPTPVPGGSITLAAGGLDVGGALGILYSLGPSAPCSVAASVPFSNPGFPDLYLPMGINLVGSADALGIVSLDTPYAGGVPAGLSLVMQGFTLMGPGLDLTLSAPLTLQF